MSETTQFKPRTDASSTTIVGRVGAASSIRYSKGNGKASVLRFSVAVAETVGKSGDLREETTWYDVVTFGGQADSLSQLELAGSRVAIVGRLRDGLPQKVALVNVADDGSVSLDKRNDKPVVINMKRKELIPLLRGGVELLGRPSQNGSAPTASETSETPAAPDQTSGEDIPF